MKAGPKIYTEEYYDTLKAIEGNHWWTLGMDDIMDRVVVPRLSDHRECRIVDMGCGSGVGLAWARSRFTNPFLVGLDISHFGIQRCSSTGADLMVGSVTEMPVGDNSFDLAICNDVLQHVEDDQQVVSEAFRVLAPGGYFFARANGRFMLPNRPGCLRLYRTGDLHSLLVKAGFEEIVLSPTNAAGSVFAVMKHYLAGRANSAGHDGDHHHHEDAEHSHGSGAENDDGSGGILIQPGLNHGQGPADRVMRWTLRVEGSLMRHFRRPVPFGHTHIVFGRKPSGH